MTIFEDSTTVSDLFYAGSQLVFIELTQYDSDILHGVVLIPGGSLFPAAVISGYSEENLENLLSEIQKYLHEWVLSKNVQLDPTKMILLHWSGEDGGTIYDK